MCKSRVRGVLTEKDKTSTMWFCYLLLLTTLPCISGNCLEDGVMIKNNTLWKKDSCTSCTCVGGLVTCEQQTCTDPQCDTTKGESLIIPANRCCPVCSLVSRRHCELNGEIVAHDTRWDGSSCSRCRCNDGVVSCSPLTCDRLQCGYGETKKQVPKHCCPICVSLADSCSFQGLTYRDGEMWSPSKCEKAVCSNGKVLLHVARCDELVCGPGEKPVVLKDECCPTCVGRSCIHQDHEYKSGESFHVDVCERCLCENGQLRCKREECDDDIMDVSCPDGQRVLRGEDECCPRCVASQGSCEYAGTTHYHGELWNISKCQVAYCSQGNVRSSPVQCTPVQCKWNERRVHISCCPECLPVISSCHHNGFNYRDGDEWQGGLCERCSCVHGVVQCFNVQCPLCPVGTIPQVVPGECCPDCQPVTCHNDCVTCDEPGYGHCTSCKQGRLLQEGKCVRRCLPGYYQEGLQCLACHSSCATCSMGNSPSTCTSCQPGSFLQEGRCVAACDVGFYLRGDRCAACRKGCEVCDDATSCHSCVDKTRLTQGGACVKSCSDGFFYNNGSCTACEDSCATCSGKNSCLSCPIHHLMEDKLCKESCSSGYFQLSISRCAACHSSCATCTGSSPSNCVTCNAGSYLHNGRCIARCPTTHFAQHGICKRCHESCQSCTGSSADECTLCGSPSHVIQTHIANSSKGTCVESCRSSYYLDGIVCKPCLNSCGTCVGPNSCSSCKFRTDVLIVTSERIGDCITKQDCRESSLDVDSVYGICFNASDSCGVQSRVLKEDVCVAECPSNSFALRLEVGTICLPCGEDCSSCQSSDRCEECVHGKFLSQLSSNCVGSCEAGYYASVGTGTCQKCPPSCATCATLSSSPQPVCTSCRDISAVLQHGHCSSSCIQQFYVHHEAGHMGSAVCRECDWSCLRCSGPTSRDCLECMPDHKLENGTCVGTCSRGFYQSSTECLPCSEDHCSSCTTRWQCSACAAPYYVHDNKCVSSCPRGYFGDVITRNCVSCPPHCLSCDDANSCTQCNAHTFLMVGIENLEDTDSRRSQQNASNCVRHCGHGYYSNKKSRICEVNRHAPSLTVTGRLLVGFGSRAMVEVLRVSDLDTSLNDLSIVVEMAPANGWFEVDNTKIPVGERIRYTKVVNGGLWFIHDSSQQRHGVAAFKASDNQLSSVQKSLDIVVVSKSPPKVVHNDPLFVSIGQSAKLNGLLIRDEDNAYDVTITLIDIPKYGSLVKLPNYETAIKSFKINDMQKNLIYYVAYNNISGSGIVYDSVTLQINDNYHVINTVLHVTILPERDFSPVLINNKITRVVKGQLSRITNHQLQLIGGNIKDKSKIVFVLNPKTTPKSGEILLMVSELSDAPHRYGIDIDDWMQTSQGYYRSQPVIRFSQRDVDDGSVWYRYRGDDEEEEAEYAALEFEVYDESGDVAEPLVSDKLQVALVSENTHPPRLARGVTSPPQISANEGRITILHSGYLHYTDEDTPDRNIIYNITRSLSPEYGSIEHADHPYVPITVFTQADVDSNKIMYRPPIGGSRALSSNQDDRDNMFEYGGYQTLTAAASVGKPRLDFEFTVSDGKHTLPSVNFTIKLTSGNSEGPTFVNQYPTIHVTVGGTATIGHEQLAVRDPDTQSHDLIFTLVKSARHGTVVRNDGGSRMILEEGDAFTYHEIQHSNLQYIHDGSDSPSSDQLQVSVTDVTHTLTKVIQVEVVEGDSTGPYPDPYCELSIVLPEATDVILSREHLAYFDQTSSDDQVTFLLESEPIHGLLENLDSGPLVPGSTFTQEDVNQSKIRFRSRGDIGSESVSDVIYFSVSDSSGNELAGQVLSITINPSLSQPPSVHVNQQLVVEDGHEVMLTTHEILATDVDTSADDLTVKIVRKPTLGRIINTISEESLRVAEEEDVWFSVRDLLDGSIFYVPVLSDIPEEMNDFLTFRVTDGITSTIVYRLNITLHATSKTVTVGTPKVLASTIECRNGHAVLIRNVSLSVHDSDTPNDQLVFTIMSELEFGKLVRFTSKQASDMPDEWEIGSMMMKKNGGMGMKKPVTELTIGSTFTYQDILDRKICYETVKPHDVTIIRRRRRDTLDFTLTDGFDVENGEIGFDLLPKVNILEPPKRDEFQDYGEFTAIEFVLEANTGLTVERGSTTVITSDNLRVSSTGEMVAYVVTRNPNVGQLQLVKNNVIRNVSATGLREFKQSDIDNGYLRYFHPLTQGGGDVFFMFDVISGMIDHRFNIHVNEDRNPPRILVNNGLTVKEGGSATILTQHLSATDDSGRLQYEITQQPKWGRLEFSSEPGVGIVNFNQDDIVSEVVKYVHTGESERTEDQFSFVLTDGSNSIMQNFYITVIPVDNSLPVLVNQGIRVQEGVRKTITSYELRAEDQDTASESITFTIVELPQNGVVERTTNGRHYVPVTTFTMQDLYESRISYNHDGTNSVRDSFVFTVTDGTNEEFQISEEESLITTTQPQTFLVKVVPVDDGTPRLITNVGLRHLEYMDDKMMNSITKNALLTEDPDTPPDLITYALTSEPRHGYLESTLNSGHKIRSFTQADINMGLIRYVLTDLPSAQTRDSFMFNVRDSLPNVVTGNTFNIRWSVISFDKDNYTVNEESKTIDITVQRKGNLNEYAIVLCRTEQGTATSSTDGRRSQAGAVDYMDHAAQVQFDEHETEKICSIQINDDETYEGVESFTVELTIPAYSLLGNITRTTVYINDDHDMPLLQFVETQYTVEERDTTVYIPIKRTGDIEKALSVICYTESKTASGSPLDRIQSGSDFKSRGRHSGESIVTFAPGVSSTTCDVKIIDDSIYEDSEEFKVHIVDASGGCKIGKFSEATVTITGPNDAPTVFLTQRRFVFNENAGTIDIPIKRSGSDLSRPTDVWCSTKQTDPVSAVAGDDFVATSTKITFRHDETTKICSLTLLDDSQSPTVEGNETFIVYLNSVQKGRLISPSEALIVINDTLDDVPKFEFVETRVSVKESDGIVSLAIRRSGDTSGEASIICYTRQNTAVVDDDFIERSFTETSRLVFAAGQTLGHCNISLVNDGIYEPNEGFSAKLESGMSDGWYGARVGDNNQVQITITNDEDAPTLEFERAEYSIREPDSNDGTRFLTVRVVRSGDVSEVSKVRCSTRDGSAKSGSDYEPKSRLLRFQAGQKSVTFKVNILSNEDTEWHETFLIKLGPNDPVNAVIGEKSQTTVTILDKDAAGSLVLPSIPIVVSLLHYDDVATGIKSDPSPGYPLICVTPCDPKYPYYVDTRSLCEEAAINASAIKFKWEVAMPTEEANGVPPFETITDNTPFTSVDTKVLDSIYFGRRFNIRCVAQAVDSVTHTAGTPLVSKVVTIGTDSGLCHSSIVSGSPRNFQAQSFIANLRYVPADAEEHPNTVHISVKIPHQDGRLPLISTMPFSNVLLLLSRSIDQSQHVCSNLGYSASDKEKAGLGKGLGFISETDYSKLSFGPGYDKPYQFDPTIREPRTIDLYKYLNLKSCTWQFDTYYEVNELIDYCRGVVDPDYQLRGAAESQITVTVPLYVSYVYVLAPRGWGSISHNTDMQFSFRYQNILGSKGIRTDGAPSGSLRVLQIKADKDGRLVLEFETHAKFRGQFVLRHRTLPNRVSRVIAPEGMNIEFELTNVFSESTYDSPNQKWRAVSTYSKTDYTGNYVVELLPCTVLPTQKWQSTPPGKDAPCSAVSPESFDIQLEFQQANRPVPVVYTLKTQFQLCNNEKVFMTDPQTFDDNISDLDYTGTYTKGQTIFGRVLWQPNQDLRSAYRLKLEKVYLCTGKDGSVPYFDPTGELYENGPQYGCIEPNKNLQHRFLLLDRSNRGGEDRLFHDVPFQAYFSSDRPEFASMREIPGVDGFLIKVDALYKVEAGHQWYIQVVYVISPDNTMSRVRRSAIFNLESTPKIRSRRSANSPNSFNVGWLDGKSQQNGTNMRGIRIDEAELSPSVNVVAIAAAVGAIVLFLIVAATCWLCTAKRRRVRRKERDLEILERKKLAMEPTGNRNKQQVAKVVDLDKYADDDELDKNYCGKVRVSNVNLNSCETPLLKSASATTKPNNKKAVSKPLLHNRRNQLDIQIVNNLRDDDAESGTEV